tara:strand:- start:132 stop:1103 length:972 start_codon:yes stop_codon:yes gene_type:complete
MPKQTFVINKVQSNKKEVDVPISFPRMKELYLDLLSNNVSEKKIQKNKTHESKKSFVSSKSSRSRSSRSDDSSYDSYSDDSRSDDSRSSYSRSSYSRSRDSRSSGSSRSRLSDRLNNLLKQDKNSSKIPTLDELNNKLDDMIPEQDEEDEIDKKRELLFKFELLKKSYKGSEIPQFNMNTDYNTLNHSYENTLRRLSIESNVDTYRTYLIGGCMGIEYILGRFLKFDMKGFTQQQMVNMSSYDKLLVELGEKSYVPQSKQWSVEIRLLCLILFNAGIFIASKMFMKGTGNNIINMMNTLSKNTTEPAKKKMKPPNIDDINDIA